jgi:hypothetical protein
MRWATIHDPSLPRVLLIGDSILNGYRATVVSELGGKANVDAWINPLHQNSTGLREQLRAILSAGNYDVVHFNMGLHGWESGCIPEGQFEPLTRKLVETIKVGAPKAALVWASSTQITVKGDATKLAPENDVIVEHNRMAAKVMVEEEVEVDDLYGLMAGKLSLGRGDRFHWTAEGSRIQGQAVAFVILRRIR